MCPQMLQEYCEEYFVSKGMCCDIAIHDPDPPGHNPHCHIMLTMRAIDENGKWMPKSRKVYDLDENGERIKLPSGRWKSHKEDTVDWNEQYHAEEWRHGWEVIQNKYLELAGSPERVDMRSYARQGIDVIPTVHMGAAVSAMERKGIETNIGNLNRDIKSANSLMAAIRKTIKSLLEWIADVSEATKEALAEMKEQNASPTLAGLLNEYLNVRKEERRDWSRYGQNKGSLAETSCFFFLIKLLGSRFSDMGSDCRLVSAVIADTKIVSQFHSCFFAGQTAQTGNEVNYISVSLASKAMKTLIDFHAWVLIIVKWADCHAVAVDLDAVHLSRLSGAYIGFYCFKYIQIITSSLKRKKALDFSQ